MIPVWAILGFSLAALYALMMLLQEKLQVEGFAVSIWCKVACGIATAPFVLAYGFPHNFTFYALTAAGALLAAIGDVVLYRSIPIVGAGVISRLMPLTVVGSFFVWFVIDPALIERYAAKPAISIAIVGVLLMMVFFAIRLRSCAVSMRAARMIWVYLFISTLVPVLIKMATQYASISQGPLAYTFCEALMMIVLWIAYIGVRRPITFASIVSPASVRNGLSVGASQVAYVIVLVLSMYHVDNPGYVWALSLLSAVMIAAFHRILGRDDGSDVKAGLGVVVCAIFLVLLKEQVR